MKSLKKRNKKWNPEAKFEGKTREEYILLPWKPFMPVETEENVIESEEVGTEVEVLDRSS